MSWMAVAIGGSALVGAGAGIFSANKASQAQSQAAGNALAYQQQTDARNQASLSPFIGAGGQATNLLNKSYADPWSFKDTPDYQFGMNEGANALQNSAAAKGGLLGGNFARGITAFGQDYATNYLGRYRQGLQSTASMGAGAAAAGAGAGNQAANMIGQSFGGVGAANASGWVGGSNALTGSIGSGVQNYLFMNAMNKSSFGGNNGGWGSYPGGSGYFPNAGTMYQGPIPSGYG